MSEDFRPVYHPQPFTPPKTSAWAKPRPADPAKVQQQVQHLLRRLALTVAQIPGQQVTMTHEFMARLFEGQARLQITSDMGRQVIVLAVTGDEILQGHAEEGERG